MGNHHCAGGGLGLGNVVSVVNLAIFLFCVLLYALNRFILGSYWPTVFMQSYFSDFLAGPVFLAYVNLLFGSVGKPQYALRSFETIAVVMLLAGAFWEFITPLYLSTAVTDCRDLGAYLLGGLAYGLLMRWLGPAHEPAPVSAEADGE